MLLGVSQQVILIPVFLHFWTSDVLAAWLAVYAAGNLILIADAGLHFRAINRFLAFKSCVDCDGRTARFYAAMLRIYLGLAAALVVLLLAGTQLVSPSAVLGFQAISNFAGAFVVMTAGMLLTLPSGLVSGLYRARGLYGRAVRLQNWGVLVGQLGQLVAIVATRDLLVVATAYVATQVLTAAYLMVIDAHRLFPFLRGARGEASWPWIVGQFTTRHRLRLRAPRIWRYSICRCCWSVHLCRSRRRGAMGSHPRHRRVAASTLPSNHASVGCRAWP